MNNPQKPRHLFLLLSLFALGLALVFRFILLDEKQNETSYIEEISENLNEELDMMEKQLHPIISGYASGGKFSFADFNYDIHYPYYIYKEGKLHYWSDHRYVPNYAELSGDYRLKYAELQQGSYIVSRFVPEENIEIFSLLPLFITSEIDNNFFFSGFNKAIFQNDNLQIRYSGQQAEHAVTTDEGAYLFSVQFGDGYTLRNQPFHVILLIIVSASIVLVLVYIWLWVRYFVHLGNYAWGFIVLLIGIILIRGGMLLFSFPFSIIELDLFNSRFYASSGINPSLGDLFLNVIGLLLPCIYVFNFYFKFQLYKYLLNRTKFEKTLFSLFFVLLGYLALYFQYSVLKNIYYHSQLSLDITASIDFPLPKIITLIIFIINATIYFLVAHVIFKVFLRISRGSFFVLSYNFAGGTLLFITLANLMEVNFIVIACVNLVYFLILYLLQLPRHMAKIKYTTFIYIFMGALISAVIGAYSVYTFEHLKTINNKQRFAEQLLVENDILGESLLFEAQEKIREDNFIRNKMFSLFSSKDGIQQKIRRFYLSSYFDKYDVNVNLFNARGNPFDVNDSLISYDEIKRFVAQDIYRTDYEELYFVNDLGASNIKRYLYLIEMKRYDIHIGYIVLDLRLKKIIPNSVYPELLVDKRFSPPSLNRSYSYAIYSENELTYSAGTYNYTKEFTSGIFTNTELYNDGLHKNGFHHLGVQSGEKTIVVSSLHEPVRIMVSNFSFLFLTFILATVTLIIVYAFYFSLKKVNLNFATKIQLYLNTAFFLPLLVISITTLSLIASSFKKDVNRQYFNMSEIISSNIISTLDNYIDRFIDRETLSNELAQVARYSESDVNLFSTNGRLIASSQPLIYGNNLLSEFINPKALAYINDLQNNRIIIEESVGTLSYKSVYVGLKSYDTGRLIGIMSIPFFESQYELDRQLIEVFSNIINIFTFIFIIFLIISYFASRLLTVPLRYITQKIKKTTLSEYNEPLVWNSNDEIGLMVGEYNRMLLNLEASKEALSRSEKESAWREMAKQVAHEIKNPLTPMKLTLQHLKRMLQEGKKGQMNFEKQINTLLHQVETLSDIATSFSSFAQMPIPKHEVFEISQVLRKIVNLYHTEKETVVLYMDEGDFLVTGDQGLMGRIFSNLIINGIQSVPKSRKPFIEVYLINKDASKIHIKVKDNGIGINETIHDKVFLPNFSTKYTGSGIGLAIAKRGIEHAGGSIWFETQEGVSTTFFIELPLLN